MNISIHYSKVTITMVDVNHGKYRVKMSSRGSIHQTIAAFAVLAIIVSSTIYIHFSSLSIFFMGRKASTCRPFRACIS